MADKIESSENRELRPTVVQMVRGFSEVVKSQGRKDPEFYLEVLEALSIATAIHFDNMADGSNREKTQLFMMLLDRAHILISDVQSYYGRDKN